MKWCVKSTALALLLVVLCEVAAGASWGGGRDKPGKGNSGNGNGNVHGYGHGQRRHRRMSAKYNNKTKAIGDDSNDNILKVQRLVDDGMDLKRAISTLSAAPSTGVCRQYTNDQIRCDTTTPFRTFDGTCNNIQNPTWGAGFTPFVRLFPASYADGFNSPHGASALPNTRLISTTMHPDLIDPDVSLTNMVPQIGQFVDHDMTFAPETDRDCCGEERHTNPDCFPIDIPSNDTFYSRVGQTCLPFTRSVPFCFPGPTQVREQMNQLTAFLDASQVYGSDPTRGDILRAHKGGRLLVNEEDPRFLPSLDEIKRLTGEEPEIMGTFAAGDDRVNEMPGLTTLHTLMVREHNRLAADIVRVRPNWSDEQVFQAARRLLIAQWQKIVYGEYLPIILGSTVMAQYGLNVYPVRFSQYVPTTNPTIFQAFATAAYRFGHTLINGLIRMMQDTTLVDTYQIRDGFFTTKQIKSFNGQGYDYILGGLMQQNAQTYDRFVTEDLSNFVLREPENNFGSDLLARNIQRARDHGVQSYNSYRQFCNLKPLTSSWANSPPEIPADSWRLLQSLYNSPLDIDLFPAGLAETPLAGAVTGPTFNCLKAHQFRATKDGDRFFYTHQGQAGSFTLQQLVSINARTLGDIICQNSNNQRTPRNVFRPVSPSNPWVACGDTINRRFLNVQDFL